MFLTTYLKWMKQLSMLMSVSSLYYRKVHVRLIYQLYNLLKPHKNVIDKLLQLLQMISNSIEDRKN